MDHHDEDLAAEQVGGGFAVDSPGHYPLGFRDFWRSQLALWEAFPDLWNHAHDIHEGFAAGSAIIQLTGTFVRDLDMPWHEFPLIQATGERIVLPPERLEFTLEYGEILSIRNVSPDGVGLLGILAVEGITLPPPGIMG
ncbi:hypothetical protein AKJ08_2648 [Vulgatibacter incomptus]|uniref:Uncharacterized protein n=1 Tax=Vulgatibacter incomptus TaxID=1391653 RepID=A0A0K1PFS4_9BACT|nr:hypothetical protein AKJ08_2648 [Vulgatibacter incomptus]